MLEILLSLSMSIPGFIVSFFLRNYFYNKSKKVKCITPILEYHFSVFSGIENDTKNKLNISYNGMELNDLYQSQIIIANTGNQPIHDFITPLIIEYPLTAEIIDVEIIERKPSERIVNYNIENNKIKFEIPLLNKHEYFKIKAIIREKEDAKDLNYEVNPLLSSDNILVKLTVPELPPVLQLDHIRNYTTLAYNRKKIDLESFIVSCVSFIQAFALFKVLSVNSIYLHIYPSYLYTVCVFFMWLMVGIGAIASLGLLINTFYPMYERYSVKGKFQYKYE